MPPALTPPLLTADEIAAADCLLEELLRERTAELAATPAWRELEDGAEIRVLCPTGVAG
jgi:hypothetical protein